MDNLYTEKQVNYITYLFNSKYSFEYITQHFNEKFNTNKSVAAIRKKCYLLGLKKNKYFTKEQKAFIINNVDKSPKELTNLYNKTFEYKRTTEVIKCFVYSQGLTFGNNDRPSQHLPLFTERKLKSGHTIVKIALENNPKCWMDNWMLKERMVYIEHHGTIPQDHSIIFLDGNIENFDINNLKCIPNSILPRLAKNNQFGLGLVTHAASDVYITERILNNESKTTTK